MKVFFDTSAWIALLNTSDGLHQKAAQIYAELNRGRTRFITTEFVLIEVADGLSSLLLRRRAIQFIEGLRTLQSVQIIPLSDELLQAGWNLYSRRPDKEWGLTDCTSFAAMTQENIARAFTSDHHFAQAGFATLL